MNPAAIAAEIPAAVAPAMIVAVFFFDDLPISLFLLSSERLP